MLSSQLSNGCMKHKRPECVREMKHYYTNISLLPSHKNLVLVASLRSVSMKGWFVVLNVYIDSYIYAYRLV